MSTTTTMHATGTFTIKSWDEQPYAELEGTPKLTHAVVVATYAGDIQGEGTSGTLMFYRDEATATFSGFERVAGTLGGRSGSFVLQGAGSYAGGSATTTWTVVPGSGTGDLTGLRGEGSYVAPSGQMEVAYRLDYAFD